MAQEAFSLGTKLFDRVLVHFAGVGFGSICGVKV